MFLLYEMPKTYMNIRINMLVKTKEEEEEEEEEEEAKDEV